MPGSALSNSRDSVVLPAPDGEDSTSSSPRRAIADPEDFCDVSLDVLHLLSELIDHGFQLKTQACDLEVV